MRSRRGLSHVHVGSLHAPDAEMALRNARDIYTRRQEGVSLWVVPAARHHRVEPGGEGRVLRPGRRQDLPAPDVLRHPRRGASTCERRTLGRLRAVAGRRRAGRGAADGRVDRRVAADRGGRRARQHRARPARPGPLAADLRRLAARTRRAPRTTWPTSATTGEFRNVHLVERPEAATSGSRWPGCWSSRRTSASSTTALRPRPTRRWPRSRPRRSRRSTTTATTPRCGCCGSATAPTSRTRRMQAGARRRVAVRRRALRRRVRRPALVADRRRRRPGHAAPGVRRAHRGRARTRRR